MLFVFVLGIDRPQGLSQAKHTDSTTDLHRSLSNLYFINKKLDMNSLYFSLETSIILLILQVSSLNLDVKVMFLSKICNNHSM
jgi:hypothetical protein